MLLTLTGFSVGESQEQGLLTMFVGSQEVVEVLYESHTCQQVFYGFQATRGSDNHLDTLLMQHLQRLCYMGRKGLRPHTFLINLKDAPVGGSTLQDELFIHDGQRHNEPFHRLVGSCFDDPLESPRILSRPMRYFSLWTVYSPID